MFGEGLLGEEATGLELGSHLFVDKVPQRIEEAFAEN